MSNNGVTPTDYLTAHMLWMRPSGCRGPYAKLAIDRMARALINTVEFGEPTVTFHKKETITDDFIKKLMGWDKE